MKNPKRIVACFFLSLISNLSLAASPQMLVDFEHATGTTGFIAKGHPSALKINGRGNCPTGQLNWKEGKVNGTLVVDLGSLDTGIATRTKHMKNKYLEVEKYPQARLTLIDLPLEADFMTKDFSLEVPFNGKLSFHGVEHPVNGTTKLDRKGQSVHINAEFAIKISDYKVDIPTFAGITVADEVSLAIQADSPIRPVQ